MKMILKPLWAVALLAGALSVGAAETKKAKAPKPYPLETCLVSGEKLGSMGEAFVFEHEGREVMLCCKSCKQDFDRETRKFVAKLEAAAKKVKKYPLKTCLVSGEPVDERAPGAVYQEQEFRFCCQDCKASFVKAPAKFAAKLPKARS